VLFLPRLPLRQYDSGRKILCPLLILILGHENAVFDQKLGPCLFLRRRIGHCGARQVGVGASGFAVSVQPKLDLVMRDVESGGLSPVY
jgi:hypothetical protein